MLHFRIHLMLVWWLILQVSHLDSSGAATEQGCSPTCGANVQCANRNLQTFPDIPLGPGCRNQVSEIDVSNNEIKTLPQDAFAGLTSLETIALSNNIIQTIPMGVFRDLTRPNELLLQSNNLSSLQRGVFDGLERLDDRLLLRCNRLAQITKGVFDNLHKLHILAIDKNLIETIEAGSFSGMGELEYLYLDKNRIVRLVSGVFSGLGELKRLDLRYNRIEVIESGAFEGLDALKELKLSSNHITTVSGIAVLHNLVTLDIADNMIKTVDEPFLDMLQDGDLQISIKENPLDCTCKMETLRIWYRENMNPTDDARCATPAEYLNMTLASIEEPLPACPVPSDGQSMDSMGNAEDSESTSPLILLSIPFAGLLVLSLCIYLLIRRHTSHHPTSRESRKNNDLEQQSEHRVDIDQRDGYQPDSYSTFLPRDPASNSANQLVEPPPPSLNGHAFRLSIEETSEPQTPAPEYLSFDDVNDPQSDEDIRPARLRQPQTRPTNRPPVPPRFV
ncbi:uncharacterized protein [Asterias amurensis]|uniref:uncharacterized protein n=1 Tax=Asterias amurensis TaxID=7602 RepID=UPI003AB42E97